VKWGEKTAGGSSGPIRKPPKRHSNGSKENKKSYCKRGRHWGDCSGVKKEQTGGGRGEEKGTGPRFVRKTKRERGKSTLDSDYGDCLKFTGKKRAKEEKKAEVLGRKGSGQGNCKFLGKKDSKGRTRGKLKEPALDKKSLLLIGRQRKRKDTGQRQGGGPRKKTQP